MSFNIPGCMCSNVRAVRHRSGFYWLLQTEDEGGAVKTVLLQRLSVVIRAGGVTCRRFPRVCVVMIGLTWEH